MSIKEERRESIRKNYSEVAKKGSSGCGCSCSSSCCGPADLTELAMIIGYTEADLASMPDGANMGLGCGNPLAIAALKEGETVLDLGSGGGFDCFLARRKVGDTGHVIGVDMTPDMIKLARENAEKSEYENVEFRLGEIEHLPVADNSVDVIISNCVINLSLDKAQVFSDAFRVLKLGGRLSISDVVATAELPDQLREDLEMLSGCVAGAEYFENIRLMLENAGFENIKMSPKDNSRDIIKSWVPDRNIEDYVASFLIEAFKTSKEKETMKKLTIEWKHLDVEGETCDRCYDTGENLANEVKRMNRVLQPKGITVEFFETKLDEDNIPESNKMLFNGVSIENILDIEIFNNYCESCTSMLGKDIYCRAVRFEGNEYDDVPAKAIRQAAYTVLGIAEVKKTTKSSCCSGDSNCCC
ncbi:MAG: methyltransferase domain-containing protein [Clostridia bacterium]|nr:methyltransferase domain-containing protein [Clostridia bacterium]